jgi:hypothetical protein
MNKGIKQLAEERLDSISKVNGFSDFGGIVLDYDLHYTTIATLKDVITVAMVEMYTAGAREATNPEVIGADQPWPLYDVLKKLIEASEILLHTKNFDGHGWEEIHHAAERAKQIIINIEGNVATTTPLSSSSGDAPFDSNNSIEQEDIYDSIYMEVVQLVEKDNIQCETYKATAEKLKSQFVIKRKQ